MKCSIVQTPKTFWLHLCSGRLSYDSHFAPLTVSAGNSVPLLSACCYLSGWNISCSISVTTQSFISHLSLSNPPVVCHRGVQFDKSHFITYYISLHPRRSCTCRSVRPELTSNSHLAGVMKSADVDKYRPPPPCKGTHLHPYLPEARKTWELLKGVADQGWFSIISMCPFWGEQKSNSEVRPKDDYLPFYGLFMCVLAQTL